MGFVCLGEVRLIGEHVLNETVYISNGQQNDITNLYEAKTWFTLEIIQTQ